MALSQNAGCSFRVGTSVATIWITLSLIAVIAIGRISPILQVGVALSTLTLVITSMVDNLDHRHFAAYLAALIAVGLLYRIFPLLEIPGLVGMDPHWYAVQTQTVIETGSAESIANPYYREAAGYIVYLAVVMELLGVRADQALLVIPVIIGIFAPLIGSIIALRVTKSRTSALGAAALIVVAPTLIRFSIIPVAQSFAVALFAVFLVLLLHQTNPQEKGMTESADILSIILVIVTLALTHKFPILVSALVLSVLAVGSWLGAINTRQTPTWMLAFTGVILLSVWTLLTPFTVDVVMLGSGLIQEGVNIGGSLAEPTAATRVQNSLWYTIGRNLHWLSLVASAGVGWVLLAYRVWTTDDDIATQSDALIILLCSAILVMLLAVGIFGAAGTLNPIRVIFLATIPLAVLIAVIVEQISTHTQRRHVATFVLVALIATQAIAVGVFPDSGPRDYLTTAEQEGKEDIATYVEEPVHTDSYYSRAGVDPENPDEEYWNRDDGQYRSYDSAVYNGSVAPLEPGYIAHRTSVDTYGHVPWGGYWTLEWKPQGDLAGCGSLTYSNGDVRMYKTGECWIED